jgi:Amidohydrolase family
LTLAVIGPGRELLLSNNAYSRVVNGWLFWQAGYPHKIRYLLNFRSSGKKIIFPMTQKPSTLSSLLYLTDTDTFTLQNLTFQTNFQSFTESIQIPVDGYIALPGFIDCGMQTCNEKVISNHVQSGFTTICILSSLETKNLCVKRFDLVDDKWVCEGVVVNQISQFKFEISSQNRVFLVETTFPDNRINGRLFGYGNDQIQCPDVYSRLENRQDSLVALKDLTVNAARALGLENTGVIRDGWRADLVLFKILPCWDLSSTRNLPTNLRIYFKFYIYASGK